MSPPLERLLAACMCLLPAACGEDPPDAPPDSPWASGARCDPALDYDDFGRGFMDGYCTRCHSSALTGAARSGAPLDHDFDSFEKIVEYATAIDEFAAAGPNRINDFMPPSGAMPFPSLQERQTLGAWLACGPAR